MFRYKLQYLPYDMVAALVVTAVTVPSALALAVVVGVPPVMGLYAAMIAPIVFGLLAVSSRSELADSDFSGVRCGVGCGSGYG